MIGVDKNDLDVTLAALRQSLLALRRSDGSWVGSLSSSALSTATAVFALARMDAAGHRSLIDRGLNWLCENQNADGGWGDTVQSPSNLSTTMLCYSAMAIPDPPQACREAIEKTESWLRQEVGTIEPNALARAVDHQYGKDRTFSVPILTMCALAGRLGSGSGAWRSVRALPFELAVLPHRLFKWLHLPVVSYALPALVAMGQARYAHRKPRNPLTCLTRHLSRRRSLNVLKTLQPDNGGFLEAAPLTSFVVMSLAASGQRDHAVAIRGAEFLAASIRADGSWPIDTDLATWVTTLSIGALAAGGLGKNLPRSERTRVLNWLLDCQYTRVHPYTQAAPGGWAWSNLPGAVPDADDTAGALIALHHLGAAGQVGSQAAEAGIHWLLGLQNADGGIPTFCRGWTKLPFDKSAPDITAHAIGAMGIWLDTLPDSLRERTDVAMLAALGFLEAAQQQEGAWLPLWFGNQFARDKQNPVYGTSRALTHLARVPEVYRSRALPMCGRALQWLLAAQNTDGGWGGAANIVSSIEETALAVDALAEWRPLMDAGAVDGLDEATASAIGKGAHWLITHTDRGASLSASPIGLYFAQLWYFEELYPLVFALAALGKVCALLT